MSQEVIGSYADGRFVAGGDTGSAAAPLDGLFVDDVHLSSSLDMTTSPGENALLFMPTGGSDLTWLGGTAGDLLYAVNASTSDGFASLSKRAGTDHSVLGYDTGTNAPVWREGTGSGGGEILYKNTSNQFGLTAALGNSATKYLRYDGSSGFEWSSTAPGSATATQMTLLSVMVESESGGTDGIRDYHEGTDIRVPLRWACFPEKRYITVVTDDTTGGLASSFSDTTNTTLYDFSADYAFQGYIFTEGIIKCAWTGDGPSAVSVTNDVVFIMMGSLTSLDAAAATDATTSYTTLPAHSDGAHSTKDLLMNKASASSTPGSVTSADFSSYNFYTTTGSKITYTSASWLTNILVLEDVLFYTEADANIDAS